MKIHRFVTFWKLFCSQTETNGRGNSMPAKSGDGNYLLE